MHLFVVINDIMQGIMQDTETVIIVLLNLNLSFFKKTLSIQISWLLMKPSDQDPQCFPLSLKIHFYNWN